MLDEFRSTSITWDKATSRIYSPVTANASDENGRKLVVQIVNGGQVEDLTGATLHLYWETRDKLHDGLDVFKAVDLKNGEFELSYTTGMLSNKGVLNANLVLIDTVGRVVSERFKITVTEGIDNDAIQSENSFSSLTQALIDISNLEQNYAPRLNDLTAQLQQTEKEAFRKKELEDLSPNVLAAIDGTGGPFNLLTIPQVRSVDVPQLKGELKSFYDKSVLVSVEEFTGNILIEETSTPLLSFDTSSAKTTIKVAGLNKYNKNMYRDREKFGASGYTALPIVLKPNTSYVVKSFVKTSGATLNPGVYINNVHDRVASLANVVQPLQYESMAYKTISTDASGCLYLMILATSVTQETLDDLFTYRDILIIETTEGTTGSPFVGFDGSEIVVEGLGEKEIEVDLIEGKTLYLSDYTTTPMTGSLKTIRLNSDGNLEEAFNYTDAKLVGYVKKTDVGNIDESENIPLYLDDLFLVEGVNMPLFHDNIFMGLSEADTHALNPCVISHGKNGVPKYDYGNVPYLTSDFSGDKVSLNYKAATAKTYYSKEISVKRNTKENVTGKSPRILMIGDSLMEWGTPTKTKDILTSLGATPTMLGKHKDAFNTPSEGKGGWTFTNIIGRNTRFAMTETNITPTGGDGFASWQRACPFLKLATAEEKATYPDWCFRSTLPNGSWNEKSYAEDTDKTGDFYIFDIEGYADSVGGAPDVITVGYGMNDINYNKGNKPAIDLLELSLRIFITRTKTAFPNVKIAVIPYTPRPVTWDLDAAGIQWVIRAKEVIDSLAYPDVHLLSVYAHMDNTFIFPKTSTNLAHGVTKKIISDDIHFEDDGQKQYGAVISSFIANKI